MPSLRPRSRGPRATKERSACAMCEPHCRTAAATSQAWSTTSEPPVPAKASKVTSPVWPFVRNLASAD
eukprot:13987615-Alexandrium_andersonii.AAC.1